MKGALAAAFLASALTVQQAVATGGGWGDAKTFRTPENCDNKCVGDKQKGGFNWGDLKTGSFDSYGGFGFSGFTCSNSFGKRSLSARTGKGSDKEASNGAGDKCITGSLSKGSKDTPETEDNKDSKKHPSISCAKSDDQKENIPFSITQIHLSTTFPTDVDCHYQMPDNTTCTHTVSCTSEKQPFTNSQCGGATSVIFKMPDHGQDKKCDIGIHSVDFDCSPPVPTNKPTSTPSSTPPSSTPPSSTPVSIPLTTGGSTPPSPPSETPISTPSSTPIAPTGGNSTYSVPSGSAPIPPVSTPMTVSTIYTTITSTTVSCASTVKNCPAESTSTYTSTSVVGVTTCPVTETTGTPQAPTSTPETPSTTPETSTSTPQAPTSTPETPSTTPETPSTPPVTPPGPSNSVVTVTTYTTETTCPVTQTITTGGSTTTSIGTTVSTTVVTTTITTCTACGAGQPGISTSVSPAPSGGSPPVPAPCPSLLPSCLNTFIPYLTTCLSNSDHSCFCPDQKLTGSVMDCIKSWGASQDEISAAYSFFAGICAAAIPSNPGIVTAVPSTITLSIPPPPSSSAPASPASVSAAPPAPAPLPATTISYTQTVTASSQTSTITSAVTVPQVSFTTNTPAAPATGASPGTTTQNVGLVPANTPSGAAGAAPTAGAPGASTPQSPSSVGGGNGTTPASPSVTPFLGAAGRVSTGGYGLCAAMVAGMAAMLL